MKKMDKRKQLEKIKKEIDLKYDKYLKKLYKQEKKLKDEIEKQDSRELLGKTFVYKNNSYSCPEKKSDYWNVHLKVIGLISGGIKVLTVEKDSHGCIIIQTENRWNNILHGYEPCKEKEFENHYNKLLEEIKSLK